MTMTDYEIVRDACVRANPEITKLKFGCQLKQQDIFFLVVGVTPKGDPITVKAEGAYDPSKPSGASLEKFEGSTEVIGRPIRLADVLLAIPVLWVQPKDKSDGFRYINNSIHSTGIKWDLSSDDLSQQSDNTLAFLADLLKP